MQTTKKSKKLEELNFELDQSFIQEKNEHSCNIRVFRIIIKFKPFAKAVLNS